MDLSNNWTARLIPLVSLILLALLPATVEAATYYVVSNLSINASPARHYFGGSDSDICAGVYGLSAEEARAACFPRLPASFEAISLGQLHKYSDPQREDGSSTVTYWVESYVGDTLNHSRRTSILTISLATRNCTDPLVPGPKPGSCIDPDPEPPQCEAGHEADFEFVVGTYPDTPENPYRACPSEFSFQGCSYYSISAPVFYRYPNSENPDTVYCMVRGMSDGNPADGGEQGAPPLGDPEDRDDVPNDPSDPGDGGDPGDGDGDGDGDGEGPGDGDDGLEGVAQEKTLRELVDTASGSNQRLDEIRQILEQTNIDSQQKLQGIIDAIGKIPGGGGGGGGGSPGGGGGGCEGDDCPPPGDDGSGTVPSFDGGTCERGNVVAPTCTHEQDPVQCAIALQSWQTRCDAQLRHEEVFGTEQWRSDHDGDSLLNEDHPGNAIIEWEVDISEHFTGFDDSGFLSESSCPVFSGTVLGFQLDFDMAPICTLAEMIGALILAFAYFWAGRILLNGVL